MRIMPNDDDFYEGDKSLKKLVSTLENFIEIDFEMENITKAICALNKCGLKEKSLTKINYPQEVIEEIANLSSSFQPLIDEYEQSKSPAQSMRDTLLEIRDELGIHSTLMYINNHLVMSLEMLFSGAIVTYAKSFNESQRRTRLSAKKIFSDNDLLSFHQEVINLRNKHYAHSEYELNKHILTYMLNDEQESVDFNVSSHTYKELWLNFDYDKFYRLVDGIQKYLKNEINSKSKVIKSKLTNTQLEKLRVEKLT